LLLAGVDLAFAAMALGAGFAFAAGFLAFTDFLTEAVFLMVFFIFIFHLYSTAPASDLFRQLGEKITELYGARIRYFPGDAHYIMK
jgi:hypothetical protein